MGFKNMFKKSSKLFDREGFYIILFVCLCIVAVTAVYISKNNANSSKKVGENPKEIQQPIDSTELVDLDNNQNDDTAPTMQQPEKNSNTSSTSTSQTNTTKKSDPVSPAVKLTMPVEGEVVKNYDKENLQEATSMEQWETHEGLDIACDIGTEVKASADGKVIEVSKDDTMAGILRTGWGMTVIIQHNNGIETVYCNLSEDVKVKKGDTVKKGQVIGIVGDTATREVASIEGSHLHFVVLKKSGKEYVTVNPKDYMK